jgi:hypothetical protein
MRARWGAALVAATLFGWSIASRDARAGLLDNPVQWVWENTQKPLLDKIKESIMAPIEAAKAKLQAIIESAKKALEDLFMENVILPGLRWAIERIIPGGAEGLKKVQNAIARYIGKIDAMIERAESIADAALAIVERSPTRLRSAGEKLEGVIEKLKSLNLQKLVEIVVGIWSEKLAQFVKSKAIQLLEKAWQLIEKPINAGKQMAIAAVGSIPFCGGVLSGVVNVLVTSGLKFLRNAVFEFVGNKAAELATTGLQKVGEWIAKGAGAVDRWLEPIRNAMRPLLDKALEMLKPLLATYTKFKGTFQSIGKVLAIPVKKRSAKALAADLAKGARAVAVRAAKQAKDTAQQTAKAVVAQAAAAAKKVGEGAFLSTFMEIVQQPVQAAHKAVAAAIGSLMARTSDLVSEKLLYPALSDAGKRLLGGQGARLADDVVQSLAGSNADVMDTDGAALLAMRGVVGRSTSDLTRAEAEILRRHGALKKSDAEILSAVLSRVSARLVAAARAQVTRQLPDAVKLLDGELASVRQSAREALSKLPVPGLAGLADLGVQKEMRQLARKLFDHIEGPAIDELRALVEMAAGVGKRPGKLPAQLSSLAAGIRGLVGAVRARLVREQSAFDALLAKVRTAKGRIAAAAGGR